LPKAKLMKKIADEVVVCVRCPLWKGRNKAVPGEGNVNASVFFVGEGPGYWEDIKGRPFVGAAGNVLNTLLEKIELPRENVFITSVVKCRPPGNREPRPKEIKTCTSLYLNRQINIIKPKIIATLGRFSTHYILSKEGYEAEEHESITKLHGKVLKAKLFDSSVSVIPMFHPASMLHNPRYREMLESDFEVLKNQVQSVKENS
jgi:uracil-DNA glycosylase family 4